MDNEKTLIEDGSPGKKLLIKLREYEGHRLLDLRYWYTDKKTKELLPTSKGIMLTRSNYLSFKSVINKSHEEIMNWLGVGYIPNSVDEYTKKQYECAHEQKYTVGNYEVSLCGFGSGITMYEISHLAGHVHIKLNTDHKFIKQTIEKTKDNNDSILLLCNIIMAFDKVKHGLGGSHSVNADALIEQLEFDWAHCLNSMAGKKK